MSFAHAHAENFDIPRGDLKAALDAYGKQAGVALMYSADVIKGARTNGAKGDITAEDALSEILSGTGFIAHRHASGAIGITRSNSAAEDLPMDDRIRTAATTVSPAPGAALETVTVTSSKIGGDVQNIPISITALSQEQLTATQTDGWSRS